MDGASLENLLGPMKYNTPVCICWRQRMLVLIFQNLEPPETLLAEFLDTCLGAGAAGLGRGRCELIQSGRRHIVLTLQGIHNPLEASLLLSEVMFHTGEERKREWLKGTVMKERQWFSGCGSDRPSYVYFIHKAYFIKRLDAGCERKREEEECEVEVI